MNTNNIVMTAILGAALALFAACPPMPPAPTPVDDADSSAAGGPNCDMTKVCPPCNCVQDAAPTPIVDAAPIKDVAAESAPTPVSVCGVKCSTCDCACACLSELGCKEGTNANCVATCNHLVSSQLTPWNPTCIAAAKTVAAVQKCPAVTCR